MPRKNSNEYRIGTEHGSVVNATTLNRLPRTHQWQRDLLKKVTAYPWVPLGRSSGHGQVTVDRGDEAPDVIEVPNQDEHQVDEPDDDGTTIRFDNGQNVPIRNFPLRREYFQGRGYAPGCRGCVSLQRGLRPVGHNQECHSRMAELLRSGSIEA